MPTESDKNQQIPEKRGLTKRQLKAIPLLVASPTYTEGCEKAKLNRTTFYEWLKNPEFKEEVERQRSQIAEEAFGILSQSIVKAVETLVGLLDHKDDRLKRLAANDVINYILKHKEIEDLDRRLTAIEQRLNERR